MQVRKRDGVTVQEFDRSKIDRAVVAALEAVHGPALHWPIATVIAGWVARECAGNAPVVGIETIQDLVEIGLMKHGELETAKAYILYRQRRAEARRARKKPDPKAVESYTHAAKYARHRVDLGRRELYEETTDRVEGMHKRRYSNNTAVHPLLRWAFDKVRAKEVLPSMRSMQFGGKAIEVNHCRMYNCAFSLCDRVRFFQETLYLLLCGAGCGFSVQFDHVEKLPPVQRIDQRRVKHFSVPDNIEGWADAVGELATSFFVTGEYVEFDYSRIRPVGAALRTSGGKAPGHLALKRVLERVRSILMSAQGRRLRPVECYDIVCVLADAVLSGGIRRSSLICLFSPEDSELMYAKTGNWSETHPWRQNSNNSVMLKRGATARRVFQRVLDLTKEWGDPGFYFYDNPNFGANPCVEIGLDPVLIIDRMILTRLEHRQQRPQQDSPDILPSLGAEFTGWGFCNLTEINAAKFKTKQDMLDAARAAAIIGTLQAGYTDFPYLGWVTEVIAERDALLGVSMTGMLDAPELALDPELQREAAHVVKMTNHEVAAMIGIEAAARTTCVKPSGTASLALGCVGSGIHAHHARRYIRRVTANVDEPVFQFFKNVNPHMCLRKPNGDWVIEFPVEAPDGAVLKEDLNAVQFLAMVRRTQQNWILPGTDVRSLQQHLHHNVSNTVHVRDDEWQAVGDYLFEHQRDFTGVALLSFVADKKFMFAPCEAVVTEADEAHWNNLVAGYQPVDYASLYEAGDDTAHSSSPACEGPSCEWKAHQ